MNIVLQILSVYYYKEQVFPSIMESKINFPFRQHATIIIYYPKQKCLETYFYRELVLEEFYDKSKIPV